VVEVTEVPAEPAAAADDDEGGTTSKKTSKKVAKARTSEPPPIDTAPATADEKKRAAMAASAAEVFAEEDDDDKPILGGGDEDEGASEGGRRRRRRRRRRGSRGSSSGDNASGGGNGLPSYTAKPAFDGEGSRGPQVIELTATDAPSLDGLAGASLSDAVALLLASFDRAVGAVSLRQIAETAQRLGKLTGDAQLAQSQIAAAVRADTARRAANGERPRFRLAGGRVGLTEWLLDGDLARLERDAVQAIGRYREASRRAFARKAAELPGHAFVELCMLLLERLGVQKLMPVKFPGASGAEGLFSGELASPASALGGKLAQGSSLPLAIVIRKDGRDVGRERVTELRGTSHHYDQGVMGWIFTTGQVLSGAREEANANGVMPVSLVDGAALARLCEENQIAVVRSTNPVVIPDVDLFEALRAT
jgi:hypothetical protein